MRLTSLTVTISVPAVTTAPAEMLRSETQPPNGARTTRSAIPARASAACALAWPASATCVSTALRVAKPRAFNASSRSSC